MPIWKRTTIPGFDITAEIFAHHSHFSPEKLIRDVPAFRPAVSLAAGMAQTIAAMEASGRIPGSETNLWEDAIIRAQKHVNPRPNTS